MLPAIREHFTGTPLTLDAVRLLIFALHTLKGPFKLFLASGVVCEGKAHLLLPGLFTLVVHILLLSA